SAHWANQHPKELPIFPLVFITVACGALSGFHATQSPLMARCMANEKLGKPVFYGSMIAEGFIGLVWATVGMSFYQGPEALAAALAAGGPGNVVSESSFALMGTVGGVLAILGVVVLPITSGDTAFRAARLTIAETLRYSQKPAMSRLYIAVPIFALGIVLSQVDFNIIWRYFGWANQSLATIMLWTGAVWLARNGRIHWICTLPATFMTAVCVSYICYEPKMGFGIGIDVANIIGVVCALAALVAFMAMGRRLAATTGQA
ncbi:MAG: carbon starvation CstA 5TM domain-containing protein, partial [Desulfovibrionaceae bacterium]|nr:carbon starvation CstA 5TM domain-containing protein [Desulfovibrionaceae bacterium]